MPVEAKICGLTDARAVEAAVAGGAAYTGFMFFPPSPRYLTPDAATALAAGVPAGVRKVGVFVDPGDADIAAVLAAAPLDLLQLHGAETPARVTAVRERFGLPVMKVVAVAGADDLARGEAYAEVADMLMFDSKPPKHATRPGGNALRFDWELLAGRQWRRPWLLAGGLTADNVAEAVAVSGAPGVDVSSAVESSPGCKDPALIKAFLDAVRAL